MKGWHDGPQMKAEMAKQSDLLELHYQTPRKCIMSVTTAYTTDYAAVVSLLKIFRSGGAEDLLLLSQSVL